MTFFPHILPHVTPSRPIASSVAEGIGMHDIGVEDPLASISDPGERNTVVSRLEQNALERGASLVSKLDRSYWANKIRDNLQARIGWKFREAHFYVLELPEQLLKGALELVRLLELDDPVISLGEVLYKVQIFAAPKGTTFSSGEIQLPAFGWRNEKEGEIRLYVAESPLGEEDEFLTALIHEMAQHVLGWPHREAFYLELLSHEPYRSPVSNLRHYVPRRALHQIHRWAQQAPEKVQMLLAQFQSVYERLTRLYPGKGNPMRWHAHKVTLGIRRMAEQSKILRLISPDAKIRTLPLTEKGISFLVSFLKLNFSQATVLDPVWLGLTSEWAGPVADPEPIAVWLEAGRLMVRIYNDYRDPSLFIERPFEQWLKPSSYYLLLINSEGRVMVEDTLGIYNHIGHNTTPAEALFAMQHPVAPRPPSFETQMPRFWEIMDLFKKEPLPPSSRLQRTFGPFEAFNDHHRFSVYLFSLSTSPSILRVAAKQQGSEHYNLYGTQIAARELPDILTTEWLNTQLGDRAGLWFPSVHMPVYPRHPDHGVVTGA